jgi:hypothetical protein
VSRLLSSQFFWNSSGSPEVNSKDKIDEQENVWTTGHYETEFNCRGSRHGLEKEGSFIA